MVEGCERKNGLHELLKHQKNHQNCRPHNKGPNPECPRYYMKAQYSTKPTDSTPEEFPDPESKASVPGNEGVKSEIFTTINRTPEELFTFWRNFKNLPLVLKHVESVECMSQERSHWRVRISEDKLIEWDAEIINERPNEMIAWQTLEGSDVQHAGSIWFTPAPGEMGTEVKLAVEYSAGKVTDFVAKILRCSPDQQMREDLRHFKQIMEAGEIPTTLGQSAGRTEDKTKKYGEAE